MDFDVSAQVDALAKLPPEPPKPAERSAWGWVPRIGKAAVAGMAGSVADVVKGAAAADALTLGADPRARGAFTDEQLQAGQVEGQRQLDTGESMTSTLGDSFRQVQKDARPDPITASTAERLVFGVAEPMLKLIGSGLTLGPFGLGAASAEIGLQQSDDLRQQGVDFQTRAKVGALTAGVTAASVALPLSGPTLKATAGLYVVGGPGGFMAQQAATSAILERAGYAEIAKQFDPFDPVGLTLSALIPLPFAAYGARNVVRGGKAGEIPPVAPVAPAGMEPLRAITPDEARSMVAGKTEKPGGVDPVRQIDASEGNGKRLLYGEIPLSEIRANEDGVRYDGTVDEARMQDYAARDSEAPPVILVRSAKTGSLNVLDGGHRVSAARLRGDKTIRAIISERADRSAVAPAPEMPTVPREAVDAAMVHNLTLQRQAQEARKPPTVALHGSDANFTEFQVMPGRNPALFFSEVVEGGRKTQAEHIASGPFGGMLYRVEIDAGKKFNPYDDPVAAQIFAELFPGRATKTVEYTDIFIDSPLVTAMKENGYNRVRVYEPSVQGMSEAVLDPSLVRIIDKQDVRSGALQPETSPTAPAPTPKPEPATPYGALTEAVTKAQDEFAAFQKAGGTLDQFLAQRELPPAVNNLLIGLTETMKDPRRAKALLDLVAKNAGDTTKSAADVTADAVEGVRALTDADLTNTPADTIAAKSDPLMQSVSERVAAVEMTNPDMVVGTTPDGKPITAREELARIRREAAEGTDTELGGADADLVNVAANCALTNGG